MLPPERRAPIPREVDRREAAAEHRRRAARGRRGRSEEPPRISPAVADSSVGVDEQKSHPADDVAVRGELGGRSAARRTEQNRRFGGRFHLDREGELGPERDQVESERPRGSNDEERFAEDPLDGLAFRRRERPSEGADCLGAALEQLLDLPLVRRRASPHGGLPYEGALIGWSDRRTPMPAIAPLELTESEAGVARCLAGLLADADRRRTLRGVPTGRARFTLSELRSRLLRERVFDDPNRLLLRLRRRGFLEELPEGRNDRAYLVGVPDLLRQLLVDESRRFEAWEAPVVNTAPDEPAEIRAMDHQFLERLKAIVAERWDETVEFGATFHIGRLADYLKGLFGETLYFDSLISLLQQYALADAPLLAPTGRVTGATGFHLALFGPPGTGKTFSIDDLIRGNPRSGVPAHGLPGRNRYCGGITPAQFLRVGSYYAGRTFNFIVPEFTDWFKYRGMVEPLKLVMEQREVKWETTFGTVGPYTFRSFFSVNYNVRTSGATDYWTTMADPNFAALEDRMLLRFHPMTRERFRAVEASAERLELGELEFTEAEPIVDHLTLVHAIETRHPLVARRAPPRAVRLDRTIYDQLRAVSERALGRTETPTFSPRLKSRAVKLAAAAALVGFFSESNPTGEPLRVGGREVEFARRFYEEEIRARSGRQTSAG